MKIDYPATVLCDFYKVSHREQYPEGTEKVYSTWTPRTSRMKNVNEVVAFGFQAFIKEFLIEYFNNNFFNRPVEDVVEEYERVIKYTLGTEKPDSSHIKALHELGYLPLRIKAVKEGTRVPVRCPMLTVENTHGEFFWLTNYIETLMSCQLWQASTSATIAAQYKKILLEWAKETGGNEGFVNFQGHDFSMRGMGSLEAAKMSGGAHLLSFNGTDTIPGILFLEKYYGANIEKELVGTSIPASEHSVMCAYGKDEFETYRHLLTEVYPKGFVSIVSDTWDLWNVIQNVIGKLKPEIMARDGKFVVRPDSGNPVEIVCGFNIINEEDALYPTESDCIFKGGKYYKVSVVNRVTGGWNLGEEISLNEAKGVIELLWDIFGGTVNEKGFKELDSHIGCIYGDAISLERCEQICSRLADKGFASTNMVYGIGSYTYQYNTRDTFGFALKSTYAEINGQPINLEKDPVTDRGIKKSQKGIVIVSKDALDRITFTQGHSYNGREMFKHIDLLEDVFIDGKLVREQKLSEIREIIKQ